MPNGVDPVWMETIHVEIEVDRLRQPAELQGSLPTAFSITVWNRVDGSNAQEVSYSTVAPILADCTGD